MHEARAAAAAIDGDKGRGAEDDPDHHAGHRGGVMADLAHIGPSQLAPDRDRDHHGQRADGRRLGRCGDAREDRDQHRQDHHKGQDHRAQRFQPFGQRCRLGGWRGQFRVHPAADRDIGHEHRQKQQARGQTAHEQPPHRLAGLHPDQDQRDRRRDQNTQRPRSADGAKHEPPVIAALGHGGHADKPRRHGRGRATARHRRQRRGKTRCADEQSAGHAPRPKIEGVIQILGDF